MIIMYYIFSGTKAKLGKPTAGVPKSSTANRYRSEDDTQGQTREKSKGTGEGYSPRRKLSVHFCTRRTE